MESGGSGGGSQRLRFQARPGPSELWPWAGSLMVSDVLASQVVLQMKLCRFLEQHWGLICAQYVSLCRDTLGSWSRSHWK